MINNTNYKFMNILKSFTVIILCLSVQLSFAQELIIKNFRCEPTDLSAKLKPTKDFNGRDCALVKVRLVAHGATFQGSIIGTPRYNDGEYWVYMTNGSKKLLVKHPMLLPSDILFNEPLQSGLTYSVSIIIPNEIYSTVMRINENRNTSSDKTNDTIGDYNSTKNNISNLDSSSNLIGEVNVNTDTLINIQDHLCSLYNDIRAKNIGINIPALETLKQNRITESNISTFDNVLYENAKKLSDEKKYDEAKKIYLELAERGYTKAFADASYSFSNTNPEAFFEWGWRDINEANTTHWIARWMGDKYFRNKEYIKAFVCYYIGIYMGIWEGDCYYRIGELFEKGYIGSKNNELALLCYREALKHNIGSPEYSDAYYALQRLGEESMYKKELYVEANATEISNLTPEQMYNKGHQFKEGSIISKRDPYKAYAYLKAAADRGNVDAIDDLVDMLKKSYYGINDKEKAEYYLSKKVEILKKQVNEGDLSSFTELGYAYKYGRGVVKDEQEARKWYERGADLGEKHCNRYLAEFLDKEGNIEEASKRYKFAAEHGDGIAMFEIAHRYHDGKGIEKNYNLYIEWLKKAAKSNYSCESEAKRELRKLGIDLD